MIVTVYCVSEHKVFLSLARNHHAVMIFEESSVLFGAPTASYWGLMKVQLEYPKVSECTDEEAWMKWTQMASWSPKILLTKAKSWLPY